MSSFLGIWKACTEHVSEKKRISYKASAKCSINAINFACTSPHYLAKHTHTNYKIWVVTNIAIQQQHCRLPGPYLGQSKVGLHDQGNSTRATIRLADVTAQWRNKALLKETQWHYETVPENRLRQYTGSMIHQTHQKYLRGLWWINHFYQSWN